MLFVQKYHALWIWFVRQVFDLKINSEAETENQNGADAQRDEGNRELATPESSVDMQKAGQTEQQTDNVDVVNQVGVGDQVGVVNQVGVGNQGGCG